MRSRQNSDYWKEYNRLDRQLQKKADTTLERFEIDPQRRSLHFKQVAPYLYSIWINRKYRILGYAEETAEGERIVWYWVGPHDPYEKQIQKWNRSR